MGAPTIKRDLLKEQRRAMKLAKNRPWYCTILQNPSGEILGVSFDRNAIGRLYDHLTKQNIDFSQAECKDFQVIV